MTKQVRFDRGTVRCIRIEGGGKPLLRVKGAGDHAKLTTGIIGLNDEVLVEAHQPTGISQRLLLEARAERTIAEERGHGSYRIPTNFTWSEKVEDRYGHIFYATFEYIPNKELFQEFDTKLSDKEVFSYGGNFTLDMKIKGATFRRKREPHILSEVLNPICGACRTLITLPKTSDAVRKMMETVDRFYETDDMDYNIEKPIKIKEKFRCPRCRNKIKAETTITPTLPTDASTVEIIRKYEAWQNQHRN